MKIMSVRAIILKSLCPNMKAGINIHQLPAKAKMVADIARQANPKSITFLIVYFSAAQPVGIEAIEPTAAATLLKNPSSTASAPKS